MEKKVIINSGCRKLIGSIDIIEDLDGDCCDKFPGDIVKVKDAYELRNDMFLGPTPTPPGFGIIPNSMVTFLDCEEKTVDIWVKIDNIRYFNDMEDKGQKYELMIDRFNDAMIQARAERAGITTAKTVPQQNNVSKLIL